MRDEIHKKSAGFCELNFVVFKNIFPAGIQSPFKMTEVLLPVIYWHKF